MFEGSVIQVLFSFSMPFFLNMPNDSGKNQLANRHRPLQDDFLNTMKFFFLWSRGIGVIGTDTTLWRAWGVFVSLILFVIVIVSIYKFVKLVTGFFSRSSVSNNVSHYVAGTTFYSSALVCLILSRRLSVSWSEISAHWMTLERKVGVNIPSDRTLKKRMVFVMCVTLTFALLEHAISVICIIDFGSSLSDLAEQYTLRSHAFLISPDDYSVWIAIILKIISLIATILWSFQDLLIVLISMGLASRYHRLNTCVAKLCNNDSNEIKRSKNTDILKVYVWRKLREAYVKQAMLVRKIDKALGGLIVLSNTVNFYFICLHIFLGVRQGITGGFFMKLYYAISFAWLCLRLGSVVMAAADIHVHSKQALRYLTLCNDRNYNIEVGRLQNQLSKDYVALSGLGFFYLDRTLLLHMAGAIVTYELILIQFYDKASSDLANSQLSLV